MSLTKLRIKIKSLAAEARIIRHEEQKFPSKWERKLCQAAPDLNNSSLVRRRMWLARKGITRADPRYQTLYLHRVASVRPEIRAAILAYGMLRGRTYKQMERTCYTKPDWPRVRRNVCTFGFLDADYVYKWIAAWKDGEPRPDEPVKDTPIAA